MDIIFPFLAGIIKRCTEWMKEAPLTKVRLRFSKLMLGMTTDKGRDGWSERQLMLLRYFI